MPKLVVMVQEKVVSEWPLTGQEAVIGRDSDCDVTLNDPSVSRYHAKVMRIYSGFFIEDLRSTNGVVLNGHRVRKHMLKDGDSVQIGALELRFVDQGGNVDDTDTVPAIMMHDTASQRKKKAASLASERAKPVYLRFLAGPDRGVSKLVDKSLFTIGEPGGNLAVISRRARGYFLMHLGGDEMTRRNGEEVRGAGVKLVNGDIIQVGGVRLEFHQEP